LIVHGRENILNTEIATRKKITLIRGCAADFSVPKSYASVDQLWLHAFLEDSDAQPVFHGTPVGHEIFTSHFNNEINNFKNMNKYL
jgi:hypothetical protein